MAPGGHDTHMWWSCEGMGSEKKKGASCKCRRKIYKVGQKAPLLREVSQCQRGQEQTRQGGSSV